MTTLTILCALATVWAMAGPVSMVPLPNEVSTVGVMAAMSADARRIDSAGLNGVPKTNAKEVWLPEAVEALEKADWASLAGLCAYSPPAWFGRALYLLALSRSAPDAAVKNLETWISSPSGNDLAGQTMAACWIAPNLEDEKTEEFLRLLKAGGTPLALSGAAGAMIKTPETFAKAAALLEQIAMAAGDSTEENLPCTGAMLTMGLRFAAGPGSSIAPGEGTPNLPAPVEAVLLGRGPLGVSVEAMLSSGPSPLEFAIASAAAALRGSGKDFAAKILGVSDETVLTGAALPLEALLDGGEPGPAFERFASFLSDAALEAGGLKGLSILGAAASAHGWMVPRQITEAGAALLTRTGVPEAARGFDPVRFGLLFHLARAMALSGMRAGADLALAMGREILGIDKPEGYYHSVGACAAVAALIEPLEAMKLIEGIRSLEWRVNALRGIFRVWGMAGPAQAKKVLEELVLWGGPIDARIRLDLSLDLFGGMAVTDPFRAIEGLKALPPSAERDFYLAMAAPHLAAAGNLDDAVDLLLSLPEPMRAPGEGGDAGSPDEGGTIGSPDESGDNDSPDEDGYANHRAEESARKKRNGTLRSTDAAAALAWVTCAAPPRHRSAADAGGPSAVAPGNASADTGGTANFTDEVRSGNKDGSRAGLPSAMPLLEMVNPAMAWPGPYLSHPLRY